jgi:hypothetical protein
LTAPHRANLSKYYEEQRYKYKLSAGTYFPAITIARNKNKMQLLLSEVLPSSEIFDFIISINREKFEGELVLTQVKLSGFNNDPYGSMKPLFTTIASDTGNDGIVIIKDIDIHLMPYVYEKFHKHLVSFMILHFEFTFQYSNQLYRVKYELHIVSTEVTISDSSNAIATLDKKLSFSNDR